MKLTKKILIALALLFVCGIVLTAFELRRIYDQNDKGELYFLYGSIQEQPFSHLVINGGNLSLIKFEPAAKPSVRVFKRWEGYKEKKVKAIVRNDTLYLDFPGTYSSVYEKMQLANAVIVRIFAPELRSVTGTNTKLQLQKLNQKELVINMSGRSDFEVQSLTHDFNKLTLSASDTSNVSIGISPSLKMLRGGTALKENETPEVVKGWNAMHIKSLNVVLSGVSIIDVGHAQVDSINMNITDSSAIILSGGAIQKNYQKRK